MKDLANFIVTKKKFVFYMIVRILIVVLGLITNIIIVRKLSLTGYGVFSIVLMFIGLVTTFGFSWSSSSILYYGSREKEETGSLNKTFWARNIIILISLIITTLLFILFNKSINAYIGLNISYLILIWLYVSVSEDYLSQYFLAVKQQTLSSTLSLTAKVLYIVLILIFDFDVTNLIILNIISHSSVLLYIVKINRNDFGKYEFDSDWFKQVLNFSLWQLFGFSGLYLINFGDTAVINYFMTTDDVGVYNAAYKLFNSIASFSFVISNFYAGTLSGYFYKKEVKKIKKFYYKERLYLNLLSLISHILVMSFSSTIIVSMYGTRYSSAVPIFNILLVGSILKYWSIYYMLYMNTNKKYKLQQTLNIFKAILNVILNILFINHFGLIGPALATTLSILITLIITGIYCEKRIYRISFS